jgi:Uma2 family endonuclease
MVKSQPLRTNGTYFKEFNNVGEMLAGRTYVMLNEHTMLYQNKKGKYVFFTIDPKAIYTEKDFMKLPEGAPFELLNGKLTYIPSPKYNHQDVSGNLFIPLRIHVKQNKLGAVQAAPLDVHLDKKNIFQPDLLFLSNERMDRKKDWIYGAPDLVVEIISPGTAKKDRGSKLKQYGKHGVLEYWIVNLETEEVEVYLPEGGELVQKQTLTKVDTLQSVVVTGFEISVAEIFDAED